MINLQDSNIVQILPTNFTSSPAVQAFGYAVNQAVRRWVKAIDGAVVWPSIDTMPESLIDLLAMELRTPMYQDDFSLEVKRNMVKNTLIWYERVGTKAVVESMLQVVFKGGKVIEWFEYGGDPYCFRVMVKTDQRVNTEEIEQMVRIVNAYKSLRSHLDQIMINYVVPPGFLYVGGAASSLTRIGAAPDSGGKERRFRQELYAGGAAVTLLKVSAGMQEEQPAFYALFDLLTDEGLSALLTEEGGYLERE